MHNRRASDITRCATVPTNRRTAAGKRKELKPQPSKKRRVSTHGHSVMSTSRNQKNNRQGGPRTELDYEIERLKAEIQQEKQMKEMLEQSAGDLEQTITELQEKFNGVDEEDNEWKTRFETQQEMNNQLEKQIVLLRDKLEQMKIPSREGKGGSLKTIYNGLSDAEIRKLMKQLDRDKHELEGQLRDLEWRLDKESKAYHTIKEERKKYLTELDETSAFIDDKKSKTRAAISEAQKEQDAQMALATKIRSQHSFNLPDNQRIIDPRKGPIKKTAAVHKLPKLGNNRSPGNSPRNVMK